MYHFCERITLPYVKQYALGARIMSCGVSVSVAGFAVPFSPAIASPPTLETKTFLWGTTFRQVSSIKCEKQVLSRQPFHDSVLLFITLHLAIG